MEKNTERDTYTLKEYEQNGSVSIADDVVAMIAALAASEVDGVGSLVGNITNGIMHMVGMNKAKGVKVVVADSVVKVDIAISIDYGYNIPKTCQDIQTKAKSAIESMTGLEVSDVNIRIASINMKE